MTVVFDLGIIAIKEILNLNLMSTLILTWGCQNYCCSNAKTIEEILKCPSHSKVRKQKVWIWPNVVAKTQTNNITAAKGQITVSVVLQIALGQHH